jgi:uncharacterized protein YndB with AHSA1/START domain
MRTDLQVSESIEINASASKVWEGLTTPRIIKEYLFGTETVTDWKVGSEIIFQGEYEGHKYRDRGVVLENVLNKKIRYSYWSGFSGLEDKPENYSTVVYTLEPLGESKTKFTWTQIGFASEQNQQHSAAGLEAFLKKIKEVIEK